MRSEISDNKTLTLYLEGRIDSANSAAVEAELTGAVSSTPHDKIVLDADDLEYISSAGLRVILRLRKNEPTLEIVNVSSDVYDIFEMTGFSEMIPIKKAFRKLSVEGCEIIGTGANGIVYRLDPDTIIKVYRDPDCLDDVNRERELARRAFVLGVPTAIPYDVVRVGDSYGSVFELLNAKSLAKIMIADPGKIDECVKISIDLLKLIHGTVVKPEDMPDMKKVAQNWAGFVAAYLTPEKGEKLKALIDAVPYDLHMLHGDYHIKNVMIQNGESLLIDMDTLCHGNPVFELASMYNAYQGFSILDHGVTLRFLGIEHETATEFWKKSLQLYLGTDDAAKIAEVEKKAMLIGFTRLMRRSIRRGGLDTDDGRKLIDLYRSRIESLLDEVDTLVI